MPKQVAVGLMFGTMLSTPVPDLDRTDYLLVLGANPFVSNGSLMTAPDVPGRLRAIRRRGGTVVVVDPRRTRTAAEASEHHFIRPGTDAYFLFGIVHALFADGLVRLGRLAEHTAAVEEVEALARPFAPEAVAGRCGIDAATIRRLARELARAERAAVYARIGTCTQEFGTLASWLVDVINVLTGHLDEVGGAMFTRAATGSPHTRGTPGRGKGVRFGRRRSRVREAPEVYGELPAACLAEEIETPGDGQIRAVVTVAGNPVLSTPNGARLADPRPGPCGDHIPARSPSRSRAPPRPPAAHGTVRRRLRGESGRTQPCRPRGESPRHRPGSARAAHPRGAPHPVGQDRAC